VWRLAIPLAECRKSSLGAILGTFTRFVVTERLIRNARGHVKTLYDHLNVAVGSLHELSESPFGGPNLGRIARPYGDAENERVRTLLGRKNIRNNRSQGHDKLKPKLLLDRL
jgi:hypothetical protein